MWIRIYNAHLFFKAFRSFCEVCNMFLKTFDKFTNLSFGKYYGDNIIFKIVCIFSLLFKIFCIFNHWLQGLLNVYTLCASVQGSLKS